MRYICIGRVHPERANLGFGQFKLEDDRGYQISASISCNTSMVTVELDAPQNYEWEIALLRANEIANLAVEAVGFSIGSACSAEILKVTEQDGASHVVGFIPVGDERDQKLGMEPHEPTFHRALILSCKNILFRRALQDYLRAITFHDDRPSYCYRAIEAIKSAFVGKTDSDQWNAMHSALGTDRTTIENTVKQYADPIRHGNWIQAKETTDNQKWDMLILTRDIIAKYMDHMEPPRSVRRRNPYGIIQALNC